MIVELLARAKDGEGVKSGPIGLAVILVLCVACYFLFKSMSKHMRRVREQFPADETGPAANDLPTDHETDAAAEPVQPPAAARTSDERPPPS